MLIGAGIGIPFQQNVLARLLGSAEFFAPLTHSAIPTRAAFGTTGTFTRATTSTWPNNDGYMVTGVAGEIGFVGARRVRNLLGNTENLLGAGWTAVGAAPVQNVVDPDGGTTGWSKALGGIGEEIRCLTTYNPAGRSGLGSVYLKGTGTVSIRLSNNVDQQFVTQFTLASDWTRVSTSVNAANSTAGAWLMGIVKQAGDTATSVSIWHPQLEDVTAQTTQTAGEYVSVGVESAPYYHGSMVDGVKCFNTDLAGNPLTTMLGYQAQGARTNLCLQSQTFDSATWQIGGGTSVSKTSNQYTAPDGSLTGDRLTCGAGLSAHYIFQTPIAWTAAAHTYSIYLKYDTNRWCVISINDTATQWDASFDLLNGVVGANDAGCTSSIIDAGNGWFICSVTATTIAANGTIYVALNDSDTASVSSWNAVGTEAIGVWGAQVELGSFASSYIATTTVAVTRNADVEAVSTSGNIAAAAGSVYLEYTPTHSPSGTIAFWGTYVDASNYTAILHDATNLIFRKRIAGVNYDATIANAFVSGTTYKVCATWGTVGTSITLNGTEGTPHANTTAAQIAATMQWGADGNSLQQPFASIRNCRDWLRQLSASERAAVTA